MKSDEDVRMNSAEAPVLFAKASDIANTSYSDNKVEAASTAAAANICTAAAFSTGYVAGMANTASKNCFVTT
eukprot:1633990-Ditylum_brightwellii.AAC.1